MDEPESREERAKRVKREMYQKAKEKTKAARLAAKASPAGVERTLRQKEHRRKEYLKAKEYMKAKLTAKKDEALKERHEARALKDEELLKALRPADAPPPGEGDPEPERPKLKLIRGGK